MFLLASQVVTLNGIERGTMETVMRYMYTGEAELRSGTVQSLLSAANLLQLTDLRDGCANFMAHKLEVDNCIGVHFFAQVWWTHTHTHTHTHTRSRTLVLRRRAGGGGHFVCTSKFSAKPRGHLVWPRCPQHVQCQWVNELSVVYSTALPIDPAEAC